MSQPFALPCSDRAAAGRALAAALHGAQYELVLGLPRGGVVVAAEIAAVLGAVLDVLLVAKLGAPDQPELALGAIAETGHMELNQRVIEALAVPPATLEATVVQAQSEIARRQAVYRPGRPIPVLRDRAVLVVDDGVATGATMLVALRAVRAERPARLGLAVPVCPRGTLERLAREADEVMALATPEPFGSVGSWYEDFRQVTDAEVVRLLHSESS